MSSAADKAGPCGGVGPQVSIVEPPERGSDGIMRAFGGRFGETNEVKKASDAAEHPPRWRVLDEEHLQDCKVFDVHRATMESPQTGDPHPFYRIASPDWVNVVAVTPDDDLVMIRQFRHGSRAVTLEIPGGIVDPGESPEVAGARELVEETGYRAGRIEPLGSINPNPALFANRVHQMVALDCERVGEVQNTSTEHTVVELLPASRLPQVLRDGGIDHALVVAALYAWELWKRDGGR